MSLAQWSHMAAAMAKEENKGFMEPSAMDDLLTDAKSRYDWIK